MPRNLFFGILGFLSIHAYAENVNLELLENLYVSPLIVFEKFLNLFVNILHEPCSW